MAPYQEISSQKNNSCQFVAQHGIGHVKYVIWRFFNKLDGHGSAECKECSSEIVYANDKTSLVKHLKSDHNDENYISKRVGVSHERANIQLSQGE